MRLVPSALMRRSGCCCARGECVPRNTKGNRYLIVLVQHDGEVLEKDRLMGLPWPV